MKMLKARKTLELSQYDLAYKLGWSRQQVSNIETGKKRLTTQTELALECLLRRADKFNK